MPAGNVYLAATDPAKHFVETLAPGAISRADIQFAETVAAGRHCRCRIRHLVVLSLDNCAWEILVYGRAAKDTGTLTTDSFRVRWRFSAADAVPLKGVYYYQLTDLDAPYEDEDRTGYLHLALVNRSPVTTKTRAVLVKFFVEETYG